MKNGRSPVQMNKTLLVSIIMLLPIVLPLYGWLVYNLLLSLFPLDKESAGGIGSFIVLMSIVVSVMVMVDKDNMY